MKVLLVDGYNVIRSTGAYEHLVDDWDAARTALIADVAAYAQRAWKATIVFDGAGNPNSNGVAHRVAGIDVIFSRAGLEADAVIESLAREARERGDSVLVVTSDAATQWTVMGGGVDRMSSLGFIEELHLSDADWREANPAGLRKSVLGERIDPSVSEKLRRWARGQD